MGQGPNSKSSPPRAPSSQMGGGEPTDFCRRAHRLQFERAPGSMHVGDAIELTPALPGPHVLRADGDIAGTIIGALAAPIARCLQDGFRFRGRIVKLDSPNGVVEVIGTDT